MALETITSTDPKVHSKNVLSMLGELTEQIRKDIDHVTDPKFQALLETTAEVLIGLQTAYRDFGEGKEKAWARQ